MTSLRFLLDTNVVSDPASRSPNPTLLKRLEAHEGECAVATPVWHELHFGLSLLPRGKRRDALAAYLQDVVRASFPILPYDDVAAEWHAKERARLQRSGRTPPFVDGQIAGIAAARGLVLVTRNRKDFRPFRGVELEDWSRSR